MFEDLPDQLRAGYVGNLARVISIFDNLYLTAGRPEAATKDSPQRAKRKPTKPRLTGEY